MRIRPQWLVTLMLMLLTLPLTGQAEDYTYETNNGTITITGYTGPGGAVTIPDRLPDANGLPVVGIGDYAFDSKPTLTGITIPDSVTSIGTYAFRNCFSLASATIGTGVKSIGFGAFLECQNLTRVTLADGLTDFQTYAFRGCSTLAWLTIPTNVITIANGAFFGAGLTNITIPRSVTSIGTGAFHPCQKLQAIMVDALNPVYTSVEGALLNKSRTLLIQCPGGKTGSYSVPDTVTDIGESAVSYCGELTDVTLGTNVTTIGNQAFFSCTKLKSMTATERVTSIGSAAFAYCAGLTNVTLGKAVVSISSRAFASCIKLTEFIVDALNPAFTTAEGVLFNKSQTALVCYPGGRAGLYTIPSGVSVITSHAFEASINLPGVVIPSGVTSLPAYAFAQSTKLTSVTIPKSVTFLGDRAFVACSSLTAVYFSGNAPSLGSSFVFYNANNAYLYYLPGTTNWATTLGGRPTALWKPKMQTTDASFGVQTNQFAFNIFWSSGMNIAVDACPSLVNPTWLPLQTNSLTADTFSFSDPDWTNSPSRFYRVRWPGSLAP
jgi:hypothetical protein